MIKYILIEDERFAYEEVKRMMKKLRADYQMSGWAVSIEQAVELLKQENIDLMIVDIRLSDGLSFEIFEQYPVDIPIIFTTAYDEYALKAFKLNSMDYLLKPIDEKELDAALCKFERRNCPTPKTPAYRQLEETYLSNNKKNRFLIQLGDAFQYVKTDEIAFFIAKKNIHIYICFLIEDIS